MIVEANDFATGLDSSFGLDGEGAAAALRRLADAIDNKQCIPQSARVLSLASLDDYTMTTLRLVYHELKPKATP